MNEAPAPPVRVLLVEDEGVIRLLTAEILREEGFEVVEAWDSAEATKQLGQAGAFDVLFTDVRMPGLLDGLDVALYARLRNPDIAVLVVSGYATQVQARLDALDPPAIFINKPYRLSRVLEALRRLTDPPA